MTRNAKLSLITFLAVVAPTATRTYAQTKASTVPISRDVIVLRLVAGQAAPATVVSLNGGLIRLGIRNGPTLALIPALRDNAVAVNVMEIVTGPTGSEALRQVATTNVMLGASATYAAGRVSLEIGLTDIRPPASSGTAQSANPCTICCVTCGDLTACACAVEMDCGQCCCPAGGCGCEKEGGPAPPDGIHSVDSSNGCVGVSAKKQSKPPRS